MICYLKKRRLVCLLLLVFVVFFCGWRLYFDSLGYDTSVMLYAPEFMLRSWYTHSRFMLVFLKRAFPVLIRNTTVMNVLTYVHVYLYTILFLYFLNLRPSTGRDPYEKTSSERFLAIRDFLCGIFLITSPYFLEQYYFTLQSAEVSLGFLVITLSFITTWFLLATKKYTVRLLLFVLTVLLVFFTVSLYQYFALMYIVGALFCLLKLRHEDLRGNIVAILWTAAILLLGLLLYSKANDLVLARVGLGKDSYLGNEWTRLPAAEVITRIRIALFATIKGSGHAYLPSFFFAILYATYRFFRSKKKIAWETFYHVCLLISPYLLLLLLGNHLLERTAMAFTYVTLYFFFLAFTDSDAFAQFFRILLVCFAVLQGIVCLRLVKGDYDRYQNDRALVRDLTETCGIREDTPVYFLGMEHTEENIPVYKGGTMGCSFFEWGTGEGQVVQDYVFIFMSLEGHTYQRPSSALEEEAGKLHFTSEYPDGQYWQETPYGYVINLGE